MKINDKKSHREWRKEAKKYRRKKIRQKLAIERDKKLKEGKIEEKLKSYFHVIVLNLF